MTNLLGDKKFKVFLLSFLVAVIMPIINGPLANAGIEITENELTHFLTLALGVGATGAAAGAVQKQHARKTAEIAANAGADPATVADLATRKSTGAGSNSPASAASASAPDTYGIAPGPQPPAPGMGSGEAARAAGRAGNPSSTAHGRKPYVPTFPILADGGGAFRSNLIQVDTPTGKHQGLTYGAPTLFVQSRYHVQDFMTGVLRDPSNNVIQITQSGVDYNDKDKLQFKLTDKSGQPLPRGKYTLHLQDDVDSTDASRNETIWEFWIA